MTHEKKKIADSTNATIEQTIPAVAFPFGSIFFALIPKRSPTIAIAIATRAPYPVHEAKRARIPKTIDAIDFPCASCVFFGDASFLGGRFIEELLE